MRHPYMDWNGTMKQVGGLADEPNTGGLFLNTSYYFRVQTVDSGLRRSTWSDEFVYATLARPITGGDFKMVADTSMTVTWVPHPAAPPWDSAAGYKVMVSTAEDFSGTVHSSTTWDVGVTTLTITGLNMGATYWVNVGALNVAGEPNYAQPGSTRTLIPFRPPGVAGEMNHGSRDGYFTGSTFTRYSPGFSSWNRYRPFSSVRATASGAQVRCSSPNVIPRL